MMDAWRKSARVALPLLDWLAHLIDLQAVWLIKISRSGDEAAYFNYTKALVQSFYPVASWKLCGKLI
jgi:hypothetical protein